ncbi:hypothetical protein BKA82DRAFT_4020346 [Pisolithus tinctorius]|nr:hypothetical protein BKA82DRAFT_4020346 [Pisolithus tinctorius]
MPQKPARKGYNSARPVIKLKTKRGNVQNAFRIIADTNEHVIPVGMGLWHGSIAKQQELQGPQIWKAEALCSNKTTGSLAFQDAAWPEQNLEQLRMPLEYTLLKILVPSTCLNWGLHISDTAGNMNQGPDYQPVLPAASLNGQLLSTKPEMVQWHWHITDM